RTVGCWESALVGAAKDRLVNVLLGYIPQRRWFAGKARRMKTASIQDVVTVPGAEGYSYLASVVIGYAEGDPDTYMLPIAYANPAEASHILERWPMSAIAWVRNQGEESRGLLYDALGPPNFAEALLGAIARRRRAAGGAGSLEYRRGKGEPVSIAILQGYVPNQGDAWQYTLNTLAHFFSGPELAGLEPPATPRSIVDGGKHDLPEVATRTIGGYLDSARLLGRRTAELHAAMSSDPTDPAFAPARITPTDQRSIYQSLSGLAMRATDLLRTQLGKLPPDTREEGRK